MYDAFVCTLYVVYAHAHASYYVCGVLSFYPLTAPGLPPLAASRRGNKQINNGHNYLPLPILPAIRPCRYYFRAFLALLGYTFRSSEN